jgi:hypothetical protein
MSSWPLNRRIVDAALNPAIPLPITTTFILATLKTSFTLSS